jgi:hypothetical protein
MKTNRRQPRRDTARDAQRVAERLASLDRDDLLALLTELAQRQPDLYDSIETAVSASSRKTKRGRHKKVDMGACRREVIGILHSLDGMRPSQAYWHVRDLVEKLRTVKERAHKLLDRGDAENALAILLVLTEEASEGIELIDDSADGSFGNFIGELGEPLAKAVRQADLNAVERERLLRKLEKRAEYLAGYDMEDVVEEAIQLLIRQQENSARGHRQDRTTKRRHEIPARDTL